MTSPWWFHSLSWPDRCLARLMSSPPAVLCSSCWRSPGRSSWPLQSAAAPRPPAFHSTTLRPPTARVAAATLGRRRRWERVPLQVYFGRFCSAALSHPRGWVCALGVLHQNVFYSLFFSNRLVELHPPPSRHPTRTRGRLRRSWKRPSPPGFTKDNKISVIEAFGIRQSQFC